MDETTKWIIDHSTGRTTEPRPHCKGSFRYLRIVSAQGRYVRKARTRVECPECLTELSTQTDVNAWAQVPQHEAAEKAAA